MAYRLVPGGNVMPFALPGSSVRRRARFLDKHVWVTPHDPAERYASGDYPNQTREDTGLAAWVEQDRPVENRDVVVWYTFGANHLPRPEDWPVMPVERIGFMLKPDGFFHRNPALDVPPFQESTPARQARPTAPDPEPPRDAGSPAALVPILLR